MDLGTGTPRVTILAGLVVIAVSGALLFLVTRETDQIVAPPLAPPAGIAYEAKDPAKEDGRLLLIGAMHLLPRSVDSPPAFYLQAIAEADEILFEIAPEEKAVSSSADLVRLHTTYQDGSNWRDHVRSDTASRVDAFAKAHDVDLGPLNDKRVYVVAQALAQRPLLEAGYSRKWGIESLLAKPAANSGKPVLGLESLEAQLQVFSALDDPREEQLLLKTIEELENQPDFGVRVGEAWWKGSTGEIAALTEDSMARYPELAKRLYIQRNERFAKVLQERVQPDRTITAVVGAAHLCGERSIIALLEEAGYTVQRIGAPRR